jgi:tetratricopeptide (TPR) repeat protein
MTRKSALTICIFGFLALAALSLPVAAADKASAQAHRSSIAPTDVRDPHYWFQKGALCATYGNNPAAVTYFGRAIALDPHHSGAHFSQGVSYGQLGQYSKAVAGIDRAIEMKPHNGLYYYGRARVYLLSGEKQKAMADFRKAAELGDEDAQAYLKSVKSTE